MNRSNGTSQVVCVVIERESQSSACRQDRTDRRPTAEGRETLCDIYLDTLALGRP